MNRTPFPRLIASGGMQSGQTVPIPPVTVKRVMVNDEATIALAMTRS